MRRALPGYKSPPQPAERSNAAGGTPRVRGLRFAAGPSIAPPLPPSPRPAMRQRISSAATPVIRTVLPVVWGALMLLGVAMLWLPVDRAPEDVAPLAVKLVFPLIALGGGALLFYQTRRLRNVWLEGDRLVVEAGTEEWLIPLSAVEQVRERRGQNSRSITVTARGPTGELVDVRFIPVTRLRLPFAPHPITLMLREQAQAARAALPGAR
jgi:hypothetical protein